MNCTHEIPNEIIDFIRLGWPIIPLTGKRPRITDWQHQATAETAKIKQWIEQFPGCNWGFVPAGTGIAVVDIDNEELWALLLQEVGFPAIQTPEVRSGNGRHLYFDTHGQFIQTSRMHRDRYGFEVISNSGQVVIPPSIHPDSGRRYHWRLDPKDIPLEVFPHWLAERLQRTNNGEVQSIESMIFPGKRNTELTSLAGTMRRRGMGRSAILAALEVENKERCHPPLPMSELESIAGSVMRYSPGGLVHVYPASSSGEPEPNRLGLAHNGGQAIWIGQELDLSKAIERPPEREHLIEDVLEVERLTLFFGKPGGLKSMNVLDWGICVATGRPWLKDDEYPGLRVTQAPVLIVSQDMGSLDIYERVHPFFSHYGIRERPEGLTIHAFPEPALDLLGDISFLAAEMRRTQARLVIIDNLFNTAGVESDNDPLIGLAVRNLAALRERTGAAIVIIHHPNKADQWSRGSTTILQNVDTSIRARRDGDYLTYEPEKERAAPILENIITRFEFEHYAESKQMKWCCFAYVSPDEYAEREYAKIEPEIRAYVGDNPGTSKNELYSNVGVQRNKASDATNRMIRMGTLRMAKKGATHCLYLPGDEPNEIP